MFGVAEVGVQKILVSARGGVQLATDLYMPPGPGPFPVLLYRTPYARAAENHVPLFMFMARRGFAVAAQDCRGTGDSGGSDWEYLMHEPEDSHDFVDWAARQVWSNGFLCSYGASYAGQTQWQMALHPQMSAILPEVSGLGGAVNHARSHLFQNAYAKTVGNGSDRISIPMTEMEAFFDVETMAGGHFDAPLFDELPADVVAMFPEIAGVGPVEARDLLWSKYCDLDGGDRARLIQLATGDPHVTNVSVDKSARAFGQRISHDRHTLPRVRLEDAAAALQAPALVRTGWYDWALNDALHTWGLLMRAAPVQVRESSRLVIAPSAHNRLGYTLGMGSHPELRHAYATAGLPDLLHTWTTSVRTGDLDAWPRVAYYLMGANEWRSATHWPPQEATARVLYLGDASTLMVDEPLDEPAPDRYTYDPADPTPTAGGSIISYLYTPGSVDVSEVQLRADVLTYSTPPLEADLDVVGPLNMVLYASSSAEDTDFIVRLSDVLPDGSAIQLQNGLIRARFRDSIDQPSALEPGRVYRFEIDMWATAVRFKAGHRIRVDVSSADFPRFDRHSNRIAPYTSASLATVVAHQTIHRSARYPSHLIFHVIPS